MARKPAASTAPATKPKARRFDRLQAYGTVTPPERGAVFYQDGGYFNSSGDLVFEDRPATSGDVVESEITTVDAKTGKVETEIVTKVVPHTVAGDPKDILKGWLLGETKLDHFSARKYVKDGYGKTIVTKDEIIEFLVNEANLVPAENVKV